MSYDNTNRGQIWPNDKKEKDTHPDFKGSMDIEGKEYWVSAWKRKPDANPKAPSLTFSVQAKDEIPQKIADQYQQQQPPAPPVPQPGGGSFDDDIPFLYVDARVW